MYLSQSNIADKLQAHVSGLKSEEIFHISFFISHFSSYEQSDRQAAKNAMGAKTLRNN